MSDLFEEYLYFVVACTGIPLGVSALAGLTVGILQAATQIQEQTIGYVVKLSAVGLTLWLGGERGWSEGLTLFSRTLEMIAVLGEVRR